MVAVLPPRLSNVSEIFSPTVRVHNGPFFFALVAVGETTYNSSHRREDLKVFSFSRKLTEGQKPRLTLVVENIGTNYLSPIHKQWLWFSYFDGSTYHRLFFGRLIAVPSSILGQLVTLEFVADPVDFLDQQQLVAEGLKKFPFYDPLFLRPELRDDPNAILEGYSFSWDVNPVNGVVSVTDILEGEDGVVVFEQGDAFYDGLDMSLDQSAKVAVELDMSVQWTQKAIGNVDFGARTFQSYSGDGFVLDWPKPLASLQRGWSVQDSSAVDRARIAEALTANWSYSYKNQEKTHVTGDVMSVTVSQSMPQVSGGIGSILTERRQNGFIDDGAVDQNNDPAPINIPASLSQTSILCPLWVVDTTLILRYDAARPRTERLRFTMFADVQPVLTAPNEPTVIETIPLSGGDVGVPLLNVLNWRSVKGQAVGVGQVILVPVSLSPLITVANYQIAITSGMASTTEPAFSATVGSITMDNTITWVGLGTTLLTTTQDWKASGVVTIGTVIQPHALLWTTWNQLLPPVPAPIAGASVSLGRIVRRSSGTSYQICTTSGTTGLVEPAFSDTRGVTTLSGSSVWTCFGDTLPNGTDFWLAISTGTTGTLEPTFGGGVGTVTVDGGVTWQSLGIGGNFIGVPIGDPGRRSYFPIDRGDQSVHYGLCIGRAHLRKASRAAKVWWNCDFDAAHSVTCRMNARIYDTLRLPGGFATGKVIETELTGDGDSAAFGGKITTGCAIGTGSSVEDVDGDPVWVVDGWVERGWQQYEGAVAIALPTTDVIYSRPLDVPDDDGVSFPIASKAQVAVVDILHGSLEDQGAAIHHAFLSAADAANLPPATSAGQSISNQQQAQKDGRDSVSLALRNNPIWWELELVNLTRTFSREYVLTVTNLTIPKMIDLESTT